MERIDHTLEDFTWIGWDAEAIATAADRIIMHKRERHAVIKSIVAGDRTFDNTIYAIESANHGIADDLHAIDLLMNVSPDAIIRQAAKEAMDRVEQALVDIEYDEGMYRAVMEYAAKDEVLEGPDRKLFDDMTLAYRRMGFGLPSEQRAALRANLKEQAELASSFEQAIAEYRDHITVTRVELAGLSDAYIEALRRDDDGNYIVGLDYPEFLPFREQCTVAERRRELIDKYLRKGGLENIERLRRILALRREHAALLGYADHAAFEQEPLMAKHPVNVRRFLDDLLDRAAAPAREDLAMLERLKRELTGDADACLAYYDIDYYIRQDRIRRHTVDDEAIREYFPLDHVISGMFAIASELFGIAFDTDTSLPRWHDAVRWHAVRDGDGSVLGRLALDLFPRQGKFDHAAMFTLVQGRRTGRGADDPYVVPVAALVCNFTPPLLRGATIRPSLLTHADVQTLFHEFGHVLHALLTTVPYASHAGSSTVRDFVEAPSQLFEYWTWDRDILKRLSRHWTTGEPLPDDVIDRMVTAKRHMIAYSTLRQLLFGLFDQEIHATDGDIDPVTVYGRLYRELFGLPPSPTQLFPAGFGHLIGYDAQYYSYLWAEVFAADMFTRFKREGLLDPGVGRSYRTWILERGGIVDATDLVRGFLGREPDNRAFLSDLGIATLDEHNGGTV